MVSTVDKKDVTPLVLQPLPQPVGEKRVVFRDLSWQQFVTIRSALGFRRSAHLIYDQGTLEITMPLQIHEFSARIIERFIFALVCELGMEIVTMGSTTLDKEALDRSAEPDDAYYIQSQPLVKGKIIDLEKDPPPDLVVEVDITHTDIDKLQLYAAMGIPEFWRYNGKTWKIYALSAAVYEEVSVSRTFPTVPKEKLYEFLADSKQGEVKAEQSLRAWARAQLDADATT